MELYCKICRVICLQKTTGIIIFNKGIEVEYYKCIICGTSNFTSKHSIINLLRYLNNNHFTK